MAKFVVFLWIFITSLSVNANTRRDSIVNYAKSLIGIPYNYGGTSKSGFDCSGFIYHIFKKYNKSVPRTSAAYKNYGKKQKLKNCQPADIIVFTGTNHSVRTPGHIGLVLRNDNGVIDFIHASSSRKHYGVTVTRYNNSGYVKRFLHITSVL